MVITPVFETGIQGSNPCKNKFFLDKIISLLHIYIQMATITESKMAEGEQDK